MPTTHTVRTIVKVSVVEEIVETATSASGSFAATVKSSRPVLSYDRTFQTGTGSNQFDRGDKKEINLAAAAQDLDLSGATFTTPGGTAWTAAKVGIIGLWNKATTTGYKILVGGDVASIPLMNTAATTMNVGPDGLFLWVNPIDGITVTAGSADILQLDPGANTIDAELIVAARSA